MKLAERKIGLFKYGLIAGLLLIVAISIWMVNILRTQESKVEWSILQAALFKNQRNGYQGKILFASESDYHFIGILLSGQNEELRTGAQNRVWVLLDSRHPPYRKILGPDNATYRLSPEEYRSIKAYAKINSSVDAELKSHLEEHHP